MSTSTGLLLVLAIFVMGVAALAILFFGRAKPKTFSRFSDKSGGAGGKLAAWVIGLIGLGLLFLSLAGIVPTTPFLDIGFLMAVAGFKALIPGQNGTEMGPRGFLIKAGIELALALACFGAAGALYSQIKDGYGWFFYGLPVFFLFVGGCMLAGGALHDYLSYLAGKRLADVEPSPEVLAELLKPPGAAPAAPPPVASPDAVALAIAAMEVPVQPQREAAGSALPGLLAGVVCLSAGMWFRATELVPTEVGHIVGVPLFVYGIIRCGLSLLALAKSFSARRI